MDLESGLKHFANSRIGKVLIAAPMALAFLFLIANSILQLNRIVDSFRERSLYSKDIIQDWLLAKAILHKTNPYLDIQELATRFIANVPQVQNGSHPSPHPPTVGILMTPLAFLSYKTAMIAWFLIELAFVAGSVYLICLTLKIKRPIALSIIAIPLSALWGASGEELVLGQLGITQLFFLSAAWYCISRQQAQLSGIFTGLAIILKPMLWPMLFFFVLKRLYKSLCYCALALLLSGGISAAILGRESLVYYATNVLPSVDGIYACSILNLSLRSIAPKVFTGIHSPIHNIVYAKPMIDIPVLGAPLGWLLPIISIVLIFFYVFRLDTQIGFSLMIIACILASPVVWGHYLVLLAIPISLLIKATIERGSRKSSYLSAILGIFLFPSALFWYGCITLLSGDMPTAKHSITIPVGLGFIMYVPTAAATLLIFAILARYGLTHSAKPNNEEILTMDADRQ